MEDVSELFKRHFTALHKATTTAKTVQDRKEVHNNARKAKRDTLANKRRHIDPNLSPLNSPTPRKNTNGLSKNRVQAASKLADKSCSSNTSITSNGVQKRLELLSKWKAEKSKRIQQEKAKAKPIFKVCHVSQVVTTDLENANKLIKGKPIVPGSASKKSQFAPPNHKFRPPQGIKPLNFGTPKVQNQTKSIPSSSSSNKLKYTPQQRVKTEPLFKKTGPESSSSTKSGTKKQTVSRTKLGAVPKESKESNSKPSTNQNLREIAKTLISRYNKDKEDGLLEPEVKKNAAVSNTNLKTSKNTRNKPADREDGSRNISTLKKSTPLQTTRSTSRVQGKKPNSTKVVVQKSPKKTVGWNVEKKNISRRQSDSDSGTVNRITYRKTPKKASTRVFKDTTELQGANKITKQRESESDLEVSQHKSELDLTPPESSSSNSDIISQDKCSRTNSDDLDTGSAQPIKSLGSTSSSSTDYTVDYNNQDSPVKSGCSGSVSTPPPYVSPFVTISRGKDSARKEYRMRTSHCKEDLNNSTQEEKTKILTAHTSPKAGALYFKRKLDMEINRIEKICTDWENYLKDPELPEDAHSSIDVAIGQSKLLISKKFQQFRGLITQCETENYEEKPVTCEDLHGFWDMIFMQVEDLDKRFANLQKLKDNKWEEILPQKVVPVKRARGRPKKAQTKSKLSQMIQQLKQKKQQNPEVIINGFECDVKTPVKEKPVEVSNSARRVSMRVSVLKERTSRCSSSPGLTMMKVSQAIKQGDGLTPARSILKTDVYKSTGKKSVVFLDDLETRSKPLVKANLFHDKDKENISENLIVSFSPRPSKSFNNKEKKPSSEDLMSFSPVPLTSRRSRRISKK